MVRHFKCCSFSQWRNVHQDQDFIKWDFNLHRKNDSVIMIFKRFTLNLFPCFVFFLACEKVMAHALCDSNLSDTCLFFEEATLTGKLSTFMSLEYTNVCLCNCREAYMSSDIRAIAAGPLFYPPQSLHHCQEIEFDNDNLRRHKTSLPALCNQSSCEEFIADKKAIQTGLTISLNCLYMLSHTIKMLHSRVRRNWLCLNME